MTIAITSFRGAWHALSNFSYLPDDHPLFPTVEHHFQALKTTDPLQATWVLEAPNPAEAKRRGKRVALRPDWEAVKVPIMRELITQKFTLDSDAAAVLASTGDAQLIEGNTWGDRVWGAVWTSQGVWDGENWLGRILMGRRTALRLIVRI